MRPSSACLNCRQGKRKCRQQSKDQTCVRCQAHGLRCSLEPQATPHAAAGPPYSAPALIAARSPPSELAPIPSPVSIHETPKFRAQRLRPTRIAGPPQYASSLEELDAHQMREMVQWYFKVIHDKHHSIFHQPSFERDLECRQIPDVILYAILALGARFADSVFASHEDQRDRGKPFAEHAFQLVDLREVTLSNVQACVLLATLCYTEGNTQSEAVYYAVANRMATVLHLPHRPTRSELERQVNLRVWWSLYMIDIWSSSGLRLPRQLQFDNGVPLPAEETYFLQSAAASILPPPARGTGIWAEMTRLARIWADIQDLNRSSVESLLDSTSLQAAVERLAGELETWRTSLPPFLLDTPPNRAHYLASGLGVSFAALHLGYHYYSQVLFYQFLAVADRPHRNPDLPAREYAKICARHAMAFCDILYECNAATEREECLYIMLGHMLVVTSTIYVHMLLFNQAGEVPEDVLRSRLQHNFNILMKLQQYWRTLESSLARLKVFHNACLRSIEESFDMDQWMLRFILEYGINLPEKFACDFDYEAGRVGEEVTEASTNLNEWYTETFANMEE